MQNLRKHLARYPNDLLDLLEGEWLSAECGLCHQAARFHREDRHAAGVVSLCPGFADTSV